MRKIISIIASLYLLLPIFVYQFKDISHTHVMKFTGSFSVIYADYTSTDFDSTLTQPTCLKSCIKIDFFNYPTDTLALYNQILLSSIISNSYSPRAPPFIYNIIV